MHEITVKPCAGSQGWLVELEGVQPLCFQSGAKAETSARALVLRLAEVGEAARATILLRDGSVAGRITVF